MLKMDTGIKKGHNPNPRTTANILSLLTFSWVLNIFKKGYTRDLEIEDLYDALDEHRSDRLGDKLECLWNLELEHANTTGKQASLLQVLIRCFGPHAVLLGLLLGFTEFFLQMTQPLFLGGLIRYFTPNSGISRETAFMYAAGIIICSTLNVFLKHPYSLSSLHTGMKIRVGLCSLIYRKALKLSKTALGETTVGEAVNLLSNDVNRFDVSIVFLSYIWVGPVETLIIAILLWQQIEVAAIVGVATILLVIPLQAFFGKMTSTLRLRTAKRTDQRIRFMNEIIVGIQVIKMYAWEKPFAHLISLARKHEIETVRSSAYMRGLLLSFGRFGTKIAVFVSIVTYVLLGNNITPEKMFVVTAYFNIMKQAMTDFFPLAIAQIAETHVSIQRIQKFLLYDEISDAPNLNSETKQTAGDIKTDVDSALIKTSDIDKKTNFSKGDNTIDVIDKDDLTKRENSVNIASEIRIVNVIAKWSDDLPENTLSNVSLDVKQGELVAIVGPVGSGKTSLLHTILKELPLTSGSVSVAGSVSYASQEPWLFTGSVRQNILFGQPMDRERYRKVIRVCALERDFHLLSHGDKTFVGERGITLSGGQRARINLARAIYKKADVYLLDDPLSAVDAHVGRHLFDDCISDFLQGKTRLLVTHQLQYLKTVDNIFILNYGAVEATGTLTKLHNSGLDFVKQLTVECEKNSDKDETFGHAGIQMSVHKMVRQISESSLHTPVRQISESSLVNSLSASEPEMEAEMRTHGGVSASVYWAYLAAGGNCGVIVLVLGVCLMAQLATSGGDYWMSFWSTVEEKRNKTTLDTDYSGWNETFPTHSPTSTQLVNINTTSVAAEMPSEWEWMPSTETCIIIYTGFVITLVMLVLGSTLLFFTVCMKASVRLHNAMFSSITRATMRFFNTNPSGQILNRFSKDMGSVDENLPQSLIDCVQIGLSIVGMITIVVIVNFWMLIPTGMMFVLFFVLRMYYVTTSRSIKRLEGITRSPVFSHLSASLQGLTTIRAFGAQAMLEKEFDNHQDLHSSAWFMFITSSRAFGVWLDSACLIFVALVTFSFLFVGGEQFGGDVGLAITQAIGMTRVLQWGMRQSAELENNMTSLERVLEYTGVESEPPLDSLPDKKPPVNWPAQGVIVFEDVSLTYTQDDLPVLQNVSFIIEPSEKVGIVGRTGAGKSSLISALFRLVDLHDGSIYIDGVDIASIGLHDLRSKISIIPQEPILFSGILRENLDPFHQYTDATLWAALEEVELKQTVDELPAGLSHKMLEGGANFSVGQRQLLCLARAIIRNNKILVLDEATANVDPQTDKLIQATIRRKFADCTVLTIAHRLHTVMDSDHILFMDAGSAVEFDHPHVLLKNESGYLYQMVEQTGHGTAESLFRMAHNNYERKVEEKKCDTPYTQLRNGS